MAEINPALAADIIRAVVSHYAKTCKVDLVLPADDDGTAKLVLELPYYPGLSDYIAWICSEKVLVGEVPAGLALGLFQAALDHLEGEEDGTRNA